MEYIFIILILFFIIYVISNLCKYTIEGLVIGGEENCIILANMIKVMYQAKGIGLAANQIGYNKRMFVMDTSNEKDSPQIFINPIIKSKNNIKMNDMEGCLSCPGEEVKVKRSITVDLTWTCRHGKLQHKTFSYLPSRVVQHEMDHLDGKLIIDEKK